MSDADRDQNLEDFSGDRPSLEAQPITTDGQITEVSNDIEFTVLLISWQLFSFIKPVCSVFR